MTNLAEDIPIVKTFIKGKRFYCYDTYTNQLLEITKEMYLEICQLEQMGISKYTNLHKNSVAYKDVLLLMHHGMFRCNYIKEIIHPDTLYVENLVNRCVSQLVLEVTKACNFKCRYCHQSRKVSSDLINMQSDVAYRSIDFIYDHSKDAHEIAITFYGGEPLLNFELIKLVVEYAKQKFQFKKISFNITTNASLLDDRIVWFMVENHFYLLISLDGDKQTQNYHRKYSKDGGATFDIVWKNVLKIREKYPEYFKSHVSFNSVILPDENPVDVISFFSAYNIPRDRLTLSNADLSSIDYTYERLFSIDSVRDSISFDEQYQDVLKRLSNESTLPPRWHHHGPCVPSARRLFVSTAGDFYTCEKVENSPACMIGNLFSGIDVNKVVELLNIGKITEEECKRCWAMRLCSMCIRECIDEGCITKDKKLLACRRLKKNLLTFFSEYIKSVEKV